MKRRRSVQLIWLALVALPALLGASNVVVPSMSLETFLIEPARVSTISVWVPTDRTGPIINRSCRPENNCTYSCTIASVVSHTKTESCLPGVARTLAECVAPHYESRLPLTIFNGWQWEYSFNICQYGAASYDLPARGGSWEASWEAILTYSVGEIGSAWIRACPGDQGQSDPNTFVPGSCIEIGTFDQMRLRNGYPKARKL
jgi:hypothetical protein